MKAPKKMTAETFITFVQRQRSDMLRTASQLLASADDAEDTVQEVLMKLWTARERFADAGEMGKVGPIPPYATRPSTPCATKR